MEKFNGRNGERTALFWAFWWNKKRQLSSIGQNRLKEADVSVILTRWERCPYGRRSAPSACAGEAIFLEWFPWRLGGKGEWPMTLSEVLQLLALIGGAIYVTFQISWTVFTYLHKKWPPKAPKLSGHFLWLIGRGADRCRTAFSLSLL